MAAIVARDLLIQLQRTLQDPDATRWTLSEHIAALNDGLLDICLYKPSACARTIVLDLAEGTLQQLGAGQSQLLRVTRNIVSDAADEPPVAGGLAVTAVERDGLDRHMPGWHSTDVVPFSKTVLHIMFDPQAPTDFYVYPGNDGSGRLEAVVAVEPTPIALPETPEDIDAYAAITIDIPSIYKSALIDYALYRAFSKDMQMAGAASRAVAHFSNFNAALGVRRQLEATVKPETT